MARATDAGVYALDDRNDSGSDDDETLVMPLVGFTRTLRTIAPEQLAPSIGLPVTSHEVVTGGEHREERTVYLGQMPSSLDPVPTGEADRQGRAPPVRTGMGGH